MKTMAHERGPHSKLSFCLAEFELYRAGPEAYIAMAARTLDHVLDNQGGIRPYRYSCDTFDDGLYVMVAEEVS
jgi:hypothetical protein